MSAAAAQPAGRVTPRQVLARALISFLLGTVTPLVVAQVAPPAGGEGAERGHRADSPAAQACRRQADDKGLGRGPERHAYMAECLRAAGVHREGRDADKGAALRAKMRDAPSGGHLRSDPPPAAAPPATDSATPAGR